MKELLRSYTIFTSRQTAKQMLQIIAALIAIFAVMSILVLVLGGGEAGMDFILGFCQGIMTMAAPMIGTLILNSVYSYNLPIVPGYRYFHSITDSGRHFKNALIVANIIGVITTLASAGISAAACLFSTMFNGGWLICLIVGFGVLGFINLFGYVKNTILRIVGICPAFAVSGFIMGFFEEGEGEIPQWVIIIPIILAAAFFVVGLIYSMRVCERRWGEQE